jgi:Tol biopolymer transport system component
MQRRLTFTHHNRYPGLVNVPRHWVRSNPQATQIAFLMRDDNGVVQLWLISPEGGEPRQLTHAERDIQSAFNWHPSGKMLGFVLENRIALLRRTDRRGDVFDVRSRQSAFCGCRRVFAGRARYCLDGRDGRFPSALDNGNRRTSAEASRRAG